MAVMLVPVSTGQVADESCLPALPCIEAAFWERYGPIRQHHRGPHQLERQGRTLHSTPTHKIRRRSAVSALRLPKNQDGQVVAASALLLFGCPGQEVRKLRSGALAPA